MNRWVATGAVFLSLAAGAGAGVFGGTALVDQAIEHASATDGNWRVDYTLGRFNANYLKRAAVAKAGLGAFVAEEALYFTATADADGRKLDGASRYLIHIGKDEMPPVDAFWSITMISGKDYFLVPNPIDRYSISDRTPGLQRNADGSIDIVIQNQPPSDRTDNWLPAPAGPFVLMLRAYEPRPALLERKWTPPRVERREVAA